MNQNFHKNNRSILRISASFHLHQFHATVFRPTIIGTVIGNRLVLPVAGSFEPLGFDALSRQRPNVRLRTSLG